MAMVYVPLGRARAAALAGGGPDPGGGLAGHAATSGLLSAHDLGPADAEDADYTALAYAGVAALLDGADPLRLVVAVETDHFTVPDAGDAFGRVELAGLAWDDVRALFADEPESAGVVARARALSAGKTLDQAVDDPEIEGLLDSVDLLWYAPEELARLPVS